MGDGVSPSSRGPVTGDACACGYLVRASREPEVPIMFDVTTNEYHLTHLDIDGTGRVGYSILRHCPWCGGAASTSKRSDLFAHITDAERRRLTELTSDVKTFDDVLARFGTPDEDHANGLTTTTPASDVEPPIVRSYRLVRYSRLSETAHVTFTDGGPEGGVRVAFEGKRIGEPRTGT